MSQPPPNELPDPHAPLSEPEEKLREQVHLPLPSDATRQALKTTGHLPHVTQAYGMADLLALIIRHGASHAPLAVGFRFA